MKNLYNKTAAIFATDYFFWGVVAFFIFQALWIAFSGRYPLPFDEGVHLGTIQVYSHHLLPFLSHQDAGTYGLGEVTRDPSYLYSYVMSLPYRWFAHFVSGQQAQVLFLRAFSVAFVAAALVVFRRLLLYTKSSKSVVHLVLLIFVLTPVASFTAGQINYDSLFILMAASALLFTVKLARDLENTKQVDAYKLGLALSFCFLATLTKYAFLPLFVAIFIYMSYKVYKSGSGRHLLKALPGSYNKLPAAKQIFLVLLVLISAGLFLERDGLNVIRYHTPSPECDQVLNVEACKQDAPWYRNYQLAHDRSNPAANAVKDLSPVVKLFRFPVFFGDWFYNMDYTLFFALGPGGLQAGNPLPLPWLLSYLGIIAGFVAIIRYYDKLKTKVKFAPLLIAIVLIYAGILCLLIFKDYNRLGAMVGAQGRYLLPILPIIYLLAVQAISIGLSRFKRADIYKFAAATAVFVCLVEGGGAIPFILKGNPTWYWPNSAVQSINRKSQAILRRVVID